MNCRRRILALAILLITESFGFQPRAISLLQNQREKESLLYAKKKKGKKATTSAGGGFGKVAEKTAPPKEANSDFSVFPALEKVRIENAHGTAATENQLITQSSPLDTL